MTKLTTNPVVPGFTPLTGLQSAWLRVLLDATSAMRIAERSRGNSFGILCRDDRYSIAYRIANRRKDRAHLSLTGWPFGCPISAECFDKDGYRDTTADEFREWWCRWREEGRALRPLWAKLEEIERAENQDW